MCDPEQFQDAEAKENVNADCQVSNSNIYASSGASNLWDHLSFMSRNKGPSFVTAYKRSRELDNLTNSLKILKLDTQQPQLQDPEGILVQSELATHPEANRGLEGCPEDGIAAKDQSARGDGQNMLDTHPDAPTSSAVPPTAVKTATDAQSMLVTYPEHTATTETNREILAPPPNTDDQNVLETHPDQAAPDDESNHTASDDSCPGVVSILVDQLSEVRAQEFLHM